VSPKYVVNIHTQGGADIRHREFFCENDPIYVPAWDEQEAKWASRDDCLWDAPEGMATKASLKHLYMSVLDEEQSGLLSRFFKKTLRIPAASWKDIIVELEHLRDSSSGDFDRILRLYDYLNSAKGVTPADSLR
jgi:hypothetical protein